MNYPYEPEVPRRRMRLPQLSKHNRRLKKRAGSEFQLWAPLWDLRLSQKAAHARGT